MKRAILIIVSLLILLALGHTFSCLIIRQRPRPLPMNVAGITKAAEQIIDLKCADCHDGARRLPFYAKLPIVGDAVCQDAACALRHWEPSSRRFMGSHATPALRAAEPMPQALLAKLGYVLKDDSMPPRAYYLTHWGMKLSPSEKAIFKAWIRHSRSAWLARWGILSGTEQTIQPIPESLPTNPAKVALGRRLYNDKRLSGDNTLSCATCHDLTKGATDNLPVSIGVDGKKGGINAPTAFNAVFNLRQFWNGRAADLAEQAGGPPLNPVEMASRNWDEICAKLNCDLTLKEKFLAVYPDGFTGLTICDAIAEYEKTLLTPDSPFDLYLKGNTNALNAVALKGLDSFRTHRCDACHVGPSMGGQSFERPDLKADFFAGRPFTDEDAGLKEFTKDARDDRRLKVPGLRNVALTAPYMHDASCATLPEAIGKMLRCTVGAPVVSNDVANLDAFLRTLNRGEK